MKHEENILRESEFRQRYRNLFYELEDSEIETLAIKYDIKENVDINDITSKLECFELTSLLDNTYQLMLSFVIYNNRDYRFLLGSLPQLQVKAQIFLAFLNKEEAVINEIKNYYRLKELVVIQS